MADTDTTEREEVRRQAAAWVVRLSDPSATAADHDQFEAWREGSPVRELAYERELAAWEVLDRLRETAGERRPRPEAPARTLQAPRWMAAALSALLLGGLTWWVGHTEPVYATALGERRVVVLEDGSRVELNTDSRIAVHFSGERRLVRLQRGEALFQIAADARPFVVDTDTARLVANDSQMNVRRHTDATIVTVTDGRVAVTTDGHRRDDDPAPAAALQEHQEGWFAATGSSRQRHVSDEDLRRLLAWQQGAIVLDGRSLQQIVAEFNRYNQRKIVVGDRTIASLRLAGYFRSEDVEGFVAAITEAFPVDAKSQPDGSIRLARRG